MELSRFNELSPLLLFLSSSLFLRHTIFPWRHVSRRLIWRVSIASNGSVVLQERSLSGISSITMLEFRRSTSDRNTTDQSWKSTDFHDRAIKRRYLPRKPKENGAKITGKTDRQWRVRRHTQSVSSRRDPRRYCKNVQSVCRRVRSGRRALDALNLKLEYQSGLSI